MKATGISAGIFTVDVTNELRVGVSIGIDRVYMTKSAAELLAQQILLCADAIEDNEEKCDDAAIREMAKEMK